MAFRSDLDEGRLLGQRKVVRDEFFQGVAKAYCIIYEIQKIEGTTKVVGIKYPEGPSGMIDERNRECPALASPLPT